MKTQESQEKIKGAPKKKKKKSMLEEFKTISEYFNYQEGDGTL